MKSTLTRALCSLVVCLTCGVTFAQPGPPGAGAAGRVTLDPGPGGPGGQNVGYAVGSPFGPQVGVNLNPGDGIGWNDGYYGADVFLPLHFDPGVSMIFGMIKVSATGNGDGVVNLGSGYRYRHLGLNRIFGFAGFLDVDDGHEETYKRVGVSFESLGRYLDFRANTYLVLGDNSNRVSSNLTGDPFFVGNFLALSRRTVTEDAYGGADFEVGGPLPYIGRYGLSGYIGPYWLHNSDSANDESTIGVKARLQAQINEDLTIGAQFSNDDIFSNNAFVNVTWTIPDGRPSRWFRQLPQRERMAQAPQREWRVAVNKYTSVGNEYLINPADNQPYQFAHIFPSNTTAGNGTIESPFNSTANFVNDPRYDVIYVRPGNAANLDDGIALLDNQRLLSTAVTHQIVAVQGTFTIPGFTGGALPVLTNPNLVNAPVVQLASNNEVSGFQIDGSNGVNPIIDGIRSQMGGIGGGFNINRNEFVNNRRATDIQFVGNGYGQFVNNILTGTGAAQTSDGGFRVIAQGPVANLDLLVANNTATGYQGFGEDVNRNLILDPIEDVNGNGQLDGGTAFEVTARDGAIVNADAPLAAVNPTGIFNNLETASGTGLLINGVNGGVVNASILNNVFQNNVDINTGMRVVSNNGLVNLVEVDSNIITGNNGNGVALFVRNTGVINGVFTNNDLRNNALASLFIDGNSILFPDNGQVNITQFTDNNLDRATQGTAGILIDTLNTDVTIANVLRNQITNGTSFGIGGEVEGGSLNLFVGDGTVANANTITGNAHAGIGFNLAGNSLSDIRILRNTIANTVAGIAPPLAIDFGGDGIRLNLTDTAILAGTSIIDQNTITGNAGFGVGVRQQISSQIASTPVNLFTVSRNTISNNDSDGVHFERLQQGANNSGVAIVENVIDNNTGDGVRLIAANADTTDGYFIERNTISNNTNGISMHVIADADLFVSIRNNSIVDNASNGIITTENVNTAADTRSTTGIWTGNTIARNGANGILFNGGIFNVQIGDNGVDADGYSNRNLIQDNTLAGIRSDSPGQAFIINNLIARNGVGLASGEGAGIDINSTIPNGNNFEIRNNLITENFGDGVELLASNDVGATIPLTLNVVMTNNDITLNGRTGNLGRGVDVLNRGTAVTNLDLGDGTLGGGNRITGNGLEGVYVVLTASTTQAQNVSAGTALLANGDLLADGAINLNMAFNDVSGNGNRSTFEGTGLVIRVGTTDAGGPNFASSPGGSGIVANIVNNTFFGNQGTDVYWESFTSTVNPAARTINTPDNPDPLSRFDVNFVGNTGGSIDITNLGAFYNNADQIKSPAGLFGSTTRRRNATRTEADTTLADFSQRSTVGPAPAPTAASFGMNPPNPNLPATVNAGAYVGVTLRFDDVLAANFGQFRYVTAYTGGPNRVFASFDTAFPVAPVAGDGFVLEAFDISGIGESTWRRTAASNTAGFTTVLSGFGTSVDFISPVGVVGEEPYIWGVGP
ncbi:MAG: right-handed parallel beta-helix repeat-containing protein [Planctomycetaceae bacterium]|nr:right-handed parallel beta-helix repeat-containing protein [Planctomycetaceae bacterium]